ncbi:MAG: T9SS type A sorting domain-containing protein [Candidatus Electryonea clarkiae]|nr:T9SS type A sorting domain-containing protein [Candidatus Electryonea clarkiae]MDP8286896.1 T9SS type A sorting domain-containing protein [Candidatus Electryonea clarkiae]
MCNGVWDEEGSPYLVMDTLTIPEDSTLIIEPGVTVEFQDQGENQYPILLYGALEAIGEEGDSIYFLSEDSTFPGFYSDNDHRDMSVIMEYCVVDSAYMIIDINHPEFAVLRHSRFHITSLIMQNFGSADTVEYCQFNYTGEDDYGAIAYNGGGPYLFSNNSGNISFACTHGTLAPVFGNNINRMRFGIGSVDIYDNVLAYNIEIDGSNINVHDNTLGGHVILRNCRGTLERNSLNDMRADGCAQITIEDNHFTYARYDHESDFRRSNIIFRGNLLTAQSDAAKFSSCIILFENNTLFFNNEGIDIRNPNNFEIQNNIFAGDGVNSYGIYIFPGHDDPANTSYNCFYNVTGATNGYEMDEGNILQDPRLNGGDPFDYHLQANSPCIDAGDPDSPDDPDGTRADIGAFFYDQSIDNPPALISQLNLIEQAGTDFSYTALAIDDEGPLTFHFENLADWLEEDENNLAWVADSVSVSGTIPEEIETFEFTVWVEDGLGQTDTSVVFCEVEQLNLLRGDTSGVLSLEDSPFLVVEDVIIPEGDSLTIEPGCELYFRFIEHEDARIGIDVYGTLIAEGTVDDSIKFLLDSNEAISGGFRGIRFFTNTDTSRYRYVMMNYALYGAKLDSTSITIENSTFLDVTNTVDARTTTSVKFDSSTCIQQNFNIFVFIYSYQGNLEVTNSQFYGTENESVFPIRCHTSHALIQNNLFDRGQSVRLVENEALFNRNILLNVTLTIYDVVNVIVSNNLFAAIYQNQYQLGVSFFRMPATIANNVFVNNSTGALISYFEEGDSLPQFVNNVFMSNLISVRADHQEFTIPSFQYNCFYDNDSITDNVLLDTTNIFLDPVFADTVDFFLFETSPLIDAGYPDSSYNDIDGTRNDIGLWGGPFGESYEYPTWVTEEPTSLPKEFRLFAPYPNPFNSSQTFYFSLPKAGDVTIQLYNLLGQKVLSQHLPALQVGVHVRTLNALNMSSGVYFLEFTTREETQRTKIILLR